MFRHYYTLKEVCEFGIIIKRIVFCSSYFIREIGVNHIQAIKESLADSPFGMGSFFRNEFFANFFQQHFVFSLLNPMWDQQKFLLFSPPFDLSLCTWSSSFLTEVRERKRHLEGER
jgi:hypothetical protein